MIGKTISHYQILAKLGGGGMGIVYKAEDTKLKRTVALKFLPPELTRDYDSKERFIHEAQAASALDHPNICNIHEIDETDDDQIFLCMAYYEGETLKKKIERGPLNLEDAIDIAIQVAQGLTKAHEQDIVHRDIKPANIMITSDGLVKIVDFGLAKLACQTKVTKNGTTLGTAAYMSPEQAYGKQVDHRTDIWSLGVVLYEMIVGQLPFRGDYDQAVVYSILNEDPEPLTGLRTGVPIQLDQIVNKALAKSPDERYQHVDELIVDLHRIEKELKSKDIPYKKSFITKTSRKGLHIFSVLGILLILGIVWVVYLGIPKEQKVPSVGILYMKNLSGEENEFWARGITEDVINTVASAGLIRVSSMKDILNVVDSNMSLFEIAKKLRVKYLLKSSLYKRDGAFDLNYQLIESETGKSIYNKKWSEPVKRASMISATLAKDILTNLDVSSKSHMTTSVTVNPAAYEMYLRGKYRWEKRQNQQDREVARGLLVKATELDQNLIVARVMLGQSYRETGDYDKATEIFRECLSESERIGDRGGQTLSVKNMADIYLLKGNYNTALEYYKESLRMARNIGDKLKEESILRNIGSVYYSKGDNEHALMYYEESLDIALELDNQRGEGDAMSNLGAIYVETGDYDRAMDSYLHSLNIFRELGEKSPEAYSKIGIGLIYAIKGNFNEAIDYFKKSLNIAQEVDDKRSEMYSIFYIGDVYYQMKQHDNALRNYQQSLEIAQSIGDLYSEGISHQALGVIMVQKNNYVLAAHHFNQACDIWKKLNDLSHYAWSFSWWGLSDLRAEDLESARDRANETESMIGELETYGEYIVIVNWNLFQVYSGLGEPIKAKSYLQGAYAEVMKRADRFKDLQDRKTFLDNVRENRDIISAYHQFGKGGN